jgi:DNA-binding response OmpR family regulator
MAETRKKILCIEDDPEVAALIAEDLVDRGFEVSIAHNGQEGLTAIVRTSPDIVLCDINMPIMSGFEMAERLAAIAPKLGNIAFVFMTAMSNDDSEIKAQRFGAYVRKPIDFDRLGSIIDARLVRLAPDQADPKPVSPNDDKLQTLT